MKARSLALALAPGLVAACGAVDQPPPAPAVTTEEAASVAPSTTATSPAAPAPAMPFVQVRARSSCAFESLDALCGGFREHLGSFDGAWTSAECAVGAPRTSPGGFAEARLVAIHSGSGRPADADWVERPLLGATVRDPRTDEVTTNVLLIARVGLAWFPIHLFAAVRGADVEPSRLHWQLSEDGGSLEWTDEPWAADRDDPHSYGRVGRTLAVVDRGVPVIAAQAQIEIWRSELDLACSRACNAEASAPQFPGCERRCTSRARATRSWERVGDEIRVGATSVERTGDRSDAIEIESEEALTVRLADASPDMLFCAFVPVVHALPRSVPRTDPDATALLDRAHALLAQGRGRVLPGALALTDPDGPRSLVAIDGQLGTGCGGGGCTTAIDHRTLEGPFPEEGVSFFAFERGPQTGCDGAILPSGASPSVVVVAPVSTREGLGCGFAGWDGTAERRWIVVQVLDGISTTP